jgi:glycosyltransferase involved in cell wall biosynthesis
VIDVAAQPAPGVNLIGFLRAESGLGEVARRLVGALERADLPFAAIDYTRTPSRREHPLTFETTTAAPYDTTVICLNADELPLFVERVGVDLLARTHIIGVWFWETSELRSSDRLALAYVDEVWAPSVYVRDVVERNAGVPVLVVPIPVEPPPAPIGISRTDLGLPSGFMFLSLFDLVSAERKNPLDVVAAFTQAFPPGAGPTLLLKTINGRERKPHLLAELIAAAADRPDIVVRDGYVSVEERDALVASCDCLVSLHRSEGYGLTMAEAMAFGKPVIATGYSGNLEFMDTGSSYLVPYELVPVPTDWWAHVPGSVWAQPDVGAAADAMRRVYSDPERARRIGARSGAALLDRHSVERAAEFMRERFAAARATIPSGPWVEQRRHVLRAALQVSHGPALGAAEQCAGGLEGRLQRALLRALWPYLEDQHAFDVEVVDALARMQRSSPASRRQGA